MKDNQLPSYLYLRKMRCAVSYDGQIQTCSLCTEQGHKYRECPYRSKSDTDNPDVKESPTSTTEQSDLEEKELTHPTKESRSDNELCRNNTRGRTSPETVGVFLSSQEVTAVRIPVGVPLFSFPAEKLGAFHFYS
ncbi:unnamed protein product [Clavelina lepadiformis]|uniref:CCHC-type domain-containing protein n=1 Tax=Clavelina lepadiformis TaxID=159417 RepID=A0ABP0F1B0_CLALP